MRYFFPAAFLFALSSLPTLSSDEKAKSDDEKKGEDAKLVQGKWQVISAQANGLPYAKSKIEKMIVLIEKDEIRVAVEGTKAAQAAKYTIDPTTSPNQIDFTKETRDSDWSDLPSSKLFHCWETEKGGKVVPAEHHAQGIYKLEGDTLTLCWRTTKATELLKGGSSKQLRVRPSVFQSILYYHQFLFVLKREPVDK